MIVISFLGTGDYKKVIYEIDGKRFETEYFPEAVNSIMKPDKAFMIVTKESKEKHGTVLSKRMDYIELLIPLGKNDDELWSIFNSIVSAIPENSDVVFDVTHGFRTQPIFILASMVYLRTLKHISVNNIFYGAYEARDLKTNIAPVFDLKPFLDLMDWAYATHEFINNGYAKGLKDILSDIHANTYTEDSIFKSEKLHSAGSILYDFSESFSVLNIKDLFSASGKFVNIIPKIKDDSNNIARAKPFVSLLNKIEDKFSQLSIKVNCSNDEFIKANINLINWYMETEHYQQAITLMNELIITRNCLLSNADPYCKKERDRIAGIMYKDYKTLLDGDKKEIDKNMKLLILDNKLRDLRNEINHAGMRENNTSASVKISNIKNYFGQLVKLLEH
jgi:hypothetical protein